MVFFFEIIRLGLKNIRLHKLRSSLTSLGIILGVAAVIVVVSIGEGNKRMTLREIRQLGATNIILRSIKPPYAATTANSTSTVVKYGILRKDLRRLEENLDDASLIVPLKSAGSEVGRKGDRTLSQVYGTSPELLKAANLRVQPRGRYLVQEDLERFLPVAVIGSTVAAQFFRLEDPIGKDIRVDNQVFKIVGVLEPIGLAGGAGSALVGRDLNLDIHVPITTVDRMFGDFVFRRQSGSSSREEVEISEIYIQTPSTEVVMEFSERAERIMELDHLDLKDVRVIVPQELLENARRTMIIWNVMLVSIAAISLLVGGIGIMNIMLASVTERTREIGIRRALGATRRNVIAQFIVETGSISALGGLIGIAVGIGISLAIGPVIPWLLSLSAFQGVIEGEIRLEPAITLWSIVVSFLVAAGVGLIFGIYPAVLASRLDPIVALRHD